jgi:pimeloyl-ACP methyl ester carboxylesterase
MPTRVINGAELHYEERGSGPETIVFSHGLLMSGDMFREQVEALSDRYRCVSYDHRGQARSAVTETGYDMDSLTADAAALISELGAAPCHFVGLSMGGFIGMRLAIHHRNLLRSLVLMDTSADPEPEEKGIMFGKTFLSDPSKAAARERWTSHLRGLNRVGTTRAAHGVIDRTGVYGQLGTIVTPTLVLVGDEDVATVPAKAERMHQAIAGSKLAVISGAGHSASIEQPMLVTTAIQDFLAAV